MHTKKLFYLLVGGLALSNIKGADLANLARVETDIAFSLQRGGVHNDSKKVLIKAAAAHALKRANTDARKGGYRLVIYDYAELASGTYVDVTLIDREKVVQPVRSEKRKLKDSDSVVTFEDDGTIDMGTSYGDVNKASHSGANSLVSPAANKMRTYLAATMQQQGFFVADDAWWHFKHESPNGDK